MLKKNVQKQRKIVEELRKAKIDALVRARKGELWIKDHQHTYNEMMTDYVEIRDLVKNMIKFRKNPFWIHAIAQSIAFLKHPIKYILQRKKARKHALDSYWEMKAIKKEWDDDFEFTNKRIDEDYFFVEQSNKFIEKQTALLDKAERFLKRKEKLRGKSNEA